MRFNAAGYTNGYREGPGVVGLPAFRVCEKAAYEKDDEALDRAVRLDLMLHAYMLVQSGIPVIYSGDEIGQEND